MGRGAPRVVIVLSAAAAIAGAVVGAVWLPSRNPSYGGGVVVLSGLLCGVVAWVLAECVLEEIAVIAIRRRRPECPCCHARAMRFQSTGLAGWPSATGGMWKCRKCYTRAIMCDDGSLVVFDDVGVNGDDEDDEQG